MTNAFRGNQFNTQYQGEHDFRQFNKRSGADSNVYQTIINPNRQKFNGLIPNPIELESGTFSEVRQHTIRRSRVIQNNGQVQNRRVQALTSPLQPIREIRTPYGARNQSSQSSQNSRKVQSIPLPPLMRGYYQTQSNSSSECECLKSLSNCFTCKSLSVCLLLLVIKSLLIWVVYYCCTKKQNPIEIRQQLNKPLVYDQMIRQQSPQINQQYVKQITSIINQHRQKQFDTSNFLVDSKSNQTWYPVSSTPLSQYTCRPLFFLYQGKCYSCPPPSMWNGTNCIKYLIVNQTGAFPLPNSHQNIIAYNKGNIKQ